MLVNKCKKCGNLTVRGVMNEFHEKFCSEKCYKNYCELNHYEAHPEKLKEGYWNMLEN